MKIMATVNYGNFQISQSWDVLQKEGQRFLIFNEVDDGSFVVIPLDEGHIKDIGELAVSADKTYVGPLNISNAVHLESN